MPMPIILHHYASPCGPLVLGACGDRLCLCDWAAGGLRPLAGSRLGRSVGAGFAEGTAPVIEAARRQLDAYFGGSRRSFDLPLLLVGTDFQRRVWSELQAIPYGHTISYSELAARVGRPSAVRAVAGANRSNLLSIFVPCHRVIGKDRSLTGYAGGLAAKQYLLALEGAAAPVHD